MELMSPALRSHAQSVNGDLLRGGRASGGPRHVAIIMDGNGRWAKKRALPRSVGHRAGVNALKRTVESAADLGLEWMTVFGFSTENWSRPAAEVAELMGLLKNYVRSDLARMEGRRASGCGVIGGRANLTSDLLEVIEHAEARTRHNNRFHLQVAFNYGGRADITEAAQRFAHAIASGAIRAEDVGEKTFGRFLSTAEGPPPDLIIRTSGVAAAIQLPFVGSRIRRTGVSGGALAGLRSRPPEGGAR